ncbi:hypothetical protein THRCLA_06970 [Thraustotheca clavata]|uniref:Uncharacterized protein n=1 Tax=Thraustotheca clavata TaxID=74557 RepID=A0A1V9ZHW4_9STRA|nr:hypothetical protein THRCLA_06970 [Thraustotheca clavata]
MSGRIDEVEYSSREILFDAAKSVVIDGQVCLDKNTQQRQRLRDFRRREKQQIHDLRQQVDYLTRRIHAFGTKPLPWNDIALALQEPLRESLAINSKLNQLVLRYRKLAMTLHEYAYNTLPPPSINHFLPHYTDASNHVLLSDPLLRLQGFQWLTERLFHNTSSALHHCGTKPSTVGIMYMDSSISYLYLQNYRVVNATLAQVTEAQRRIYIDNTYPGAQGTLLDTEITSQAFDPTNFAYFDLDYTPQRHLHRIFVQDTRSVLVGLTIAKDEAQPGSPCYKSTEYGWSIAEFLTPTTTQVMEFWITTLHTPQTKSEYSKELKTPFEMLENESEIALQDRFYEHHQVEWRALAAHCSQLFDDTLNQVHVLPHLTSWQHYTLPHANQARVKSMSWITEWLYQNTTMALSHSKGEGYYLDFVPTETLDLSYTIHQQQFTMNISLQDISECQRRIYLDHQCPGLPASFIDHELTLSCFGRDISYFDLGDGSRAIYRIFTSPQRVVLVCSSIMDELFAKSVEYPENYGNGWIIMDQSDNSTTKVTELFITSVNNSIEALEKIMPGPIPSDLIVDDCKRQEIIQHYTKINAQENHKYCNQLFADTIRALEQDKLKMV